MGFLYFCAITVAETVALYGKFVAAPTATAAAVVLTSVFRTSPTQQSRVMCFRTEVGRKHKHILLNFLHHVVAVLLYYFFTIGVVDFCTPARLPACLLAYDPRCVALSTAGGDGVIPNKACRQLLGLFFIGESEELPCGTLTPFSTDIVVGSVLYVQPLYRPYICGRD